MLNSFLLLLLSTCNFDEWVNSACKFFVELSPMRESTSSDWVTLNWVKPGLVFSWFSRENLPLQDPYLRWHLRVRGPWGLRHVSRAPSQMSAVLWHCSRELSLGKDFLWQLVLASAAISSRLDRKWRQWLNSSRESGKFSLQVFTTRDSSKSCCWLSDSSGWWRVSE